MQNRELQRTGVLNFGESAKKINICNSNLVENNKITVKQEKIIEKKETNVGKGNMRTTNLLHILSEKRWSYSIN